MPKYHSRLCEHHALVASNEVCLQWCTEVERRLFHMTPQWKLQLIRNMKGILNNLLTSEFHPLHH